MKRAGEQLRLAPLSWVAGEWDTADVARPARRGQSLRVLTWNVYFGGYCFEERREALLSTLEALRPDVVALQEVTPELLEPLLEEAWLRAGYQVGVQLDERHEPLGAYGVALLSRAPIQRLTQVALPSTMGRSLLAATLAIDGVAGGALTVATVHLESLDETRLRVAQLEIIQPFLTGLGGDVVLVGDTNFDDAAQRERAALDPSFVDVWPRLHPGDPGYTVDTSINTMRYQLKERESRKRIDRVLLRAREWQARSITLVGTEAFDAAETFVSDHFGLLVELERLPDYPR